MNLTLVYPSDIVAMWPFIAKHIERAVQEEASEYHPETLCQCLVEGTLQLWVAYEANGVGAICVTEAVRYFNTPLLSIRWLVGDEPEKWVDQIENIERWAARNGYKGLEVWGRTGWAKLLRPMGYREKFRILHKMFS
jgi:hypothetical protein